MTFIPMGPSFLVALFFCRDFRSSERPLRRASSPRVSPVQEISSTRSIVPTSRSLASSGWFRTFT